MSLRIVLTYYWLTDGQSHQIWTFSVTSDLTTHK